MRLVDRLWTPRNQGQGLRAVQLFETWRETPQEGNLNDFKDYVHNAYRSNGVIFSAILARMSLFSEARFKFKPLDSDRLFGNEELRILERPWRGGTTGDLIARMEQDASLAGNAYIYRDPERGILQRLRPDWVEIVTDGYEVVGYLYTVPGKKPVLLPEMDVAHWAPIPDPDANFRGMSWITPVAEEVLADKEMTKHKRKFLQNAATPNMIVKVDGKLPTEVKRDLKAALAERHEGVENAYRTLLLEGGADAKIVGKDLREMSFDLTQAGGENRIAVASGVPSVVIGLKEGLQAATYSNYQQAMRRFADLTGHPAWRGMAGALEKLVNTPPGAELWYDTSDVAALREDTQKQAEIDQRRALTLEAYVRAGYTPESAIEAVTSGDITRLVHTGLFSVQLHPPGETDVDAAADADANADVEQENTNE